jgi:predicted nuclease with RNAse H fold
VNFIGVDVHKEKLTVANIDKNLNIELIDNINTQKLIEYVKNRENLIIAVDAPYKLNHGFMNNDQYRMLLDCKLKGHYNKKVSEYELSRRGINPFSTPGNMNEITGWKGWMNTGFNLYSNLENLGYKEISINGYKNNIHGFIEVFPHACFTTLLDYIPSKKDTDEGLKERIDILEKVGFKDINKILQGSGKHEKTDKLDALVAAYTAYLSYKGSVTFVGDLREGHIVLPTINLKDSYKRLKVIIEPEVITSSVVEGEKTKCSLSYEYVNVDSVLWIKYFTPLDSSTPFYNIIVGNGNNRVKVIITNDQNQYIEIELELLKNRKDGLKVCKEHKTKLKNFWGSHGDKKIYKISIIKES